MLFGAYAAKSFEVEIDAKFEVAFIIGVVGVIFFDIKDNFGALIFIA